MKLNLREFPRYFQEEMEQKMDKEAFGIKNNSYNYGPYFFNLSNGEKVVFTYSKPRISPSTVGEKYVNVEGIEISPKGFFKFLKKRMVKIIPKEDQEKIKLNFLEKISGELPEIKEVSFSD